MRNPWRGATLALAILTAALALWLGWALTTRVDCSYVDSSVVTQGNGVAQLFFRCLNDEWRNTSTFVRRSS